MAFNVKHLSICCFPSVYFFDEMSVRNFCPFLNRSLFSFFLAMLCLPCYAEAFSSVDKWGLLSSCSAWASLVVEHRLYGARVQQLWQVGPDCPTVWETLVPGPGIKPVCPALQGGFLTPGPSREAPFSLVEF